MSNFMTRNSHVIVPMSHRIQMTKNTTKCTKGVLAVFFQFGYSKILTSDSRDLI